MKEILVFAGTTEGRQLSEILAASRIMHTVCVATEYGEHVLNPNPLVTVQQGRMAQEEIREFLFKENYEAVIDATHPYAEIVTRNIKEAVKELKDMGKTISYLRLKREEEKMPEGGDLTFLETSRDCALALKDTEGNILLTTGRKELSAWRAFLRAWSREYAENRLLLCKDHFQH